MFQYNGPEAYEILWHIGEGSIRILPEKTSPEVLHILEEESHNAKLQIFIGELLTLSKLLKVGHGSFFWVGVRAGIFWRMELLRPAEKRLLLHLSPILHCKDLCDILMRSTAPSALLQSSPRIERLLLCLDQRGCYRAVSISEQFSREIGLEEHDDVEKLIQHLIHFQSTALFDISLQTGRALQFTDIAIYNNKPHHLVITVVPINHKKRQVMLTIYFVGSETFYQIQLQGSSDALPPPRGEGLGFAFFRQKAQAALSLEHCNSAFRGLLSAEQSAEFFAALAARLPDEPGSEVRFRYRPSLLKSYDCFASRTEEGVFLTLGQDSLQKIETIGEKLTQREREIATCLCSGSPLRYIASYCGISEGTVKKTASNIYRKLGVAGRMELLRLLSE